MTAVPIDACTASPEESLGTGRRGGGTSFALERALRGLATLPFALRRRLLRLFFDLVAPVAIEAPHPALVTACAKTLSLSRKDSVRFLYRSLLYDALFQMEWVALGRRSKAGLLRDARHVSLEQQLEMQWLVNQNGAVLATMHFGPYSLGLVWLFHRYLAGRTVLVLKSRTDDADEQAAVARLSDLGVDLRFVSPDSSEQTFEMVKLVRRGAFAIVMVDLPPAYGRTSPVEALGHTLHFTRGAIDVAALSGVPLVLFRTISDIVGDRIELADIFEVTRNSARSHEDAQKRVNRFITRTISSCPDQWHMWTRFHEYQNVEVMP